ncbi:Hypothetical protein, putative [Bodo saltans]|uniref:Uncharacterized protein n=1 Tax=Bodo saltans TaxID=75058 RepID=A0A0S4ILZ9_BODSA|nr:Hypothetical protein, putative [Bodo saltans]|eukprot:CUF35163.1 Hypothetical protein, putative [Bodo saltans]
MSVTSLRVSSLSNTNASTHDHVDPLAQLPKSTQSRGHDDEDTITSDERTTSPSSHREGSGAASDAPAQQERFLPGELVSKRFPRHVKAMATLLRSLSKDIVRASLMAGPTSNTQSIRQEVERLICAICCVYWNDDIVLELCGSYATATALRDSDLNISLSSRKPHHLLERPELYLNQLHEFINLHLRGVLASSISGGTRSSPNAEM